MSRLHLGNSNSHTKCYLARAAISESLRILATGGVTCQKGSLSKKAKEEILNACC